MAWPENSTSPPPRWSTGPPPRHWPDTLGLSAGLTFCDGTGLRALNRLTRQVHTARVSLHLTGLNPRLYRTPGLLKAAAPWLPPALLP
ncbi:STAS domain-containing protein [Streptomyces sp. NPDC059534]|uniref:STAS domain-containing protein n=1 Tax=Streptomyces sp. NPDC059534 TaxID=3346859 RepID=UPI0036C8A158